jgi:hypothetical protein
MTFLRELSDADLNIPAVPVKPRSTESSHSELKTHDGKSYHRLFVHCDACKDTISVPVDDETILTAPLYPVEIVFVHGTPYHAILIRIDKNFDSRGERVVHLEFE